MTEVGRIVFGSPVSRKETLRLSSLIIKKAEEERSNSMEQVESEGDAMSNKVKEAMETLSKAMKEDEGYAWSWHSNIAVSMIDVGIDHKTANLGAARFMQLCFKVDTSQSRFFKVLFPEEAK